MILDPNEVLIAYLGAGPAGGYQPLGSPDERLRAAYPSSFDDARAIARKYIDGAPDHPPEDWAGITLADETKTYEQKLAKQYPELEPRALSALACRWAFDWQ